MSCSSLGVNAFRSSFQIVAQQLSRPCSKLRWPSVATPPSRCFSLWQPPSLRQQQQQQQQDRLSQYRQGSVANAAVFGNPRRPGPVQRSTRLRTFMTSNHAVITHYVDLPPNYKDEVGLPFLKRDLDSSEVVALFGPNMSTRNANELLRILHGRRVAGTLEDPGVQVNTTMFSSREQKIALDYLRRTIAVDEITNAGLRAEDELAELEGHVTEDGKKPYDPGYTTSLKLHKETPANEGVYGRGAFDMIRAKNRAKREEELKRLEEEEAKRKLEEEASGVVAGELATREERGLGHVHREPSPQMQKWLDQGTSDLEAPPEMTKSERLLPSAVVVLLATVLLAAYATYYRPLKRSERLFPDIPPAAATVGAIIVANLLIYAVWKIPPLWGVMNRYFLLAPATPRVAALFGSMFSHQELNHIFINMATLWFIGTQFHDDVGRGDFLATYFAAGSIGFLGSMTNIVLRNQLHLTTLGASGSVYGIAAAYFWMHRFEGFKFFGLPPEPFNGVPGMAFIALVAGVNIAGFFSTRHRLDIISHLVALATGIAAGHLIEKRKEAKRRTLLGRDEGTRSSGPGPVPAVKSPEKK